MNGIEETLYTLYTVYFHPDDIKQVDESLTDEQCSKVFSLLDGKKSQFVDSIQNMANEFIKNTIEENNLENIIE